MKDQKADVLVVGAGPTGLLTAALLAEAGIDVQIIDREERTAARSYACALHPSTLELLDRLGLATALLERGQRVNTMAFYDGSRRRAEIKFSELPGRFPFVLVLPQSELEALLEDRLADGMKVQWNHRLDGIEQEEKSLLATVEELEGTSMGYIVPHWETVVKRRYPIRARFIVGADGYASVVRQRLGLETEEVAAPVAFVACELVLQSGAGDEVRVVLDDECANVLWPMADNECRWSFQLIHSEVSHEFPEKDRRAFGLESALNEQLRGNLQKLLKHRAPWFSEPIKDIAWCKQVFFQQRLVKAFGQGRGWLVGDAAHQTGPIGVHSLNAGLHEASVLAGKLKKALCEGAPLSSLREYDQEQQSEWRRLLGLNGGLKPRKDTNDWVRERSARLLTCMPASGPDLKLLADQLRLDI